MPEQGFTEEERFLISLGQKAFLKPWCFPNLYRDEGKTSDNADGKEVCDLAAIFHDKIIIFSDKSVVFSKDLSRKTAWLRWSKKAIKESIGQLVGAAKWFKGQSERIYLDKKCEIKLGDQVPIPLNATYYLIAVTHGAEDVLQKERGIPSFALDNRIQANDHWHPEKTKPFHLGKPHANYSAHVFTENDIQIILNEFDTINDFISYLNFRNDFLNSNLAIQVESEQDLVYEYWHSYNPSTKTYMFTPDRFKLNDSNIISHGGIKALDQSPYYLKKKTKEQISYLVDDIVQEMHRRFVRDKAQGNITSYNQYEKLERHLAEMSRVQRRVFSESFVQIYMKHHGSIKATRRYNLKPDFMYLFHLFPPQGSRDYGDYLSKRQELSTMIMIYEKCQNPELETVICLASMTPQMPKLAFQVTKDFLYDLDVICTEFPNWSEKDYINAKASLAPFLKSGVMGELTPLKAHIKEFEDLEEEEIFFYSRETDGLGSKRCPCGSGKSKSSCCGY